MKKYNFNFLYLTILFSLFFISCSKPLVTNHLLAYKNPKKITLIGTKWKFTVFDRNANSNSDWAKYNSFKIEFLENGKVRIFSDLNKRWKTQLKRDANWRIKKETNELIVRKTFKTRGLAKAYSSGFYTFIFLGITSDSLIDGYIISNNKPIATFIATPL